MEGKVISVETYKKNDAGYLFSTAHDHLEKQKYLIWGLCCTLEDHTLHYQNLIMMDANIDPDYKAKLMEIGIDTIRLLFFTGYMSKCSPHR